VSLLEVVLYLLVVIVGTVLVFTRRPIDQLFVYTSFGISLTLLFFALHAPDVALSEIAVGTLILPLVVLVALMKTGNKI
jgi:energy-converting hydrogenase B subunit D